MELEEEKSEKKSGAQKSRQPKQYDDDYGDYSDSDGGDADDDTGMCDNYISWNRDFHMLMSDFYDN